MKSGRNIINKLTLSSSDMQRLHSLLWSSKRQTLSTKMRVGLLSTIFYKYITIHKYLQRRLDKKLHHKSFSQRLLLERIFIKTIFCFKKVPNRHLIGLGFWKVRSRISLQYVRKSNDVTFIILINYVFIRIFHFINIIGALGWTLNESRLARLDDYLWTTLKQFA